MPERSVWRLPAPALPSGLVWSANLPRPTRLLNPPEPIVATALLPDQVPALFMWRRVRHRVVKANGPERITGEWWLSEREVSSVRDYYRVEDEAGARFWVFRDAPAAQGGRWWLHGVFA
jgi:protein ImuB